MYQILFLQIMPDDKILIILQFYIKNIKYSIYNTTTNNLNVIFVKYNLYVCICYRNTLSITVLQHLIEEIKKAGEDLSLKSIVLCGNGPVFSAGHNLNELVSFCLKKNVLQSYLWGYSLIVKMSK